MKEAGPLILLWVKGVSSRLKTLVCFRRLLLFKNNSWSVLKTPDHPFGGLEQRAKVCAQHKSHLVL